MKNLRQLFLGLGTFLACVIGASSFAQTTTSPQSQSLRVGIVSMKRCLEESKLGKQEQANFEKMKSQMESVLQDKEKALEDIENKLNDEDYIDSITAEAESELKRKRRTLRQEALQLQNQYMHTLQQANLKIVQKLTDSINKASEQVAREANFDVIINDEACTFYSKGLDVSDRIVAKMNATYDAEGGQKEPSFKK
jgi:outer membrane protein